MGAALDEMGEAGEWPMTVAIPGRTWGAVCAWGAACTTGGSAVASSTVVGIERPAASAKVRPH
jgi:hypothetical protein